MAQRPSSLPHRPGGEFQLVNSEEGDISSVHCPADGIDRILGLKRKEWDFPGAPVAKTPSSQCRGPQAPQLKILHAATESWSSLSHKESVK